MARAAKKIAEKNTDGDALPPFEASLEELEEIVRDIEEGRSTLEESITRYERGMKLVHHCRQVLDRAETKIRMLTEGEKGLETEGNDQ